MIRCRNIYISITFSALVHFAVFYLSPFHLSAEIPEKKEVRVVFKIKKLGKQKVMPVKKKVITREPRRLVKMVKPVRKQTKPINHTRMKIPIVKPVKIMKRIFPARTEPPAPEPVTDRLEEDRFRFNELVRSKIEEEKVYPRIARKMGIQGDVLVGFTILPNGSVCDVEILSGIKSHKLLRKAAVSTIEKAAPYLPVPSHLIKEKGLRMKLKIAYKIT